MKRAGLTAAVLLLLTLTACGSSGPSRSYKLGRYDGPRLASSVTDVSPSGIAYACRTHLAGYRRTVALQNRALALPDNQGQDLTPVKQIDVVSTPDFSMHAHDLSGGDYLSGCEAALTARLR